MTKKEDGIPWPMGIGFGVFFWFSFQPEVEDFVLNLPWIIKFIVFPFAKNSTEAAELIKTLQLSLIISVLP